MAPPDRRSYGYFLDGGSVSRTDGSVVVRKGDSLEIQQGSELVDLRPGDSLAVEGFEKGGDIIFIVVSGSEMIGQIDVETLDRYLDSEVIAKE